MQRFAGARRAHGRVRVPTDPSPTAQGISGGTAIGLGALDDPEALMHVSVRLFPWAQIAIGTVALVGGAVLTAASIDPSLGIFKDGESGTWWQAAISAVLLALGVLVWLVARVEGLDCDADIPGGGRITVWSQSVLSLAGRDASHAANDLFCCCRAVHTEQSRLEQAAERRSGAAAEARPRSASEEEEGVEADVGGMRFEDEPPGTSRSAASTATA
ncbi:hypothetical protein FNF31_03677 [Cafeteria roenbergensis]|uniref:Uncharacterized protein n=1 Tax=Cafeteria roenbergensis TaxID=33653 RepID=A0A5A8DIB0_CAFRO|nr:hypothetical protein FNF31_03677 [Cafeteria roenbergensis]KAA0165243.1 hypothetical protein FNF28_03524 [Cafeteria roenbergensis]